MRNPENILNDLMRDLKELITAMTAEAVEYQLAIQKEDDDILGRLRALLQPAKPRRKEQVRPDVPSVQAAKPASRNGKPNYSRSLHFRLLGLTQRMPEDIRKKIKIVRMERGVQTAIRLAKQYREELRRGARA